MYTQRYCALIDILGFTARVLETSNDSAETTKIWSLLVGAATAGRFVVDASRKEYKFHAFSDTVVLSDEVSQGGLVAILEACVRLAHSFLASGFLCRGAVTKGPLNHDEKILFGQAMIRAHELESRVAKVPRILLDDGVVGDIYSRADSDRKLGAIANHHLFWSDDGLSDLNTFARISDAVTFLSLDKPMFMTDTFRRDREPTAEEDENFRRNSAASIGALLWSKRSSASDPRHLEKVAWLINRFNCTVPKSRYDRLYIPTR